MEYLISTIFYFLIFNIIILLFGCSLITVFYKKLWKNNFSSVQKFVISYSLGFSFYIILSYFFITVWNFNQFTGIYFYIIFDLIGLVYFIKKQKIFLNFRQSICNVKGFLKRKIGFNKNKIINLVSLIIISSYIIGFYIYKYWPIISSSTAQFSQDPYFWEGQIYYLLKFKALNYPHLGDYPGGFVIFTSGMLQLIPNIGIEQMHFAMKMFPSLMLMENIFLMGLLGMTLFPKRKIFILILTSSVFFFPYFMYRSLLFVPTILITELEILMLFLIYYKNVPSKFNILLLGLILGSMILIHPLYGLINILIFFIYRIFYDIFFSKSKESVIKTPIFKKIVNKLQYTIKNNIYIGLIVIGIYFLYVGNIIIKVNFDYWIKNSYFYFFSLILNNPIENFILFFSDFSIKTNFNHNFLMNIVNPILPNDGILIYINHIINSTSTSFYYFIFLIICLIWPTQKYFNRKYDKIIIFSKVVTILCLIFLNFRPFFLSETFWNVFSVRSAEIVTPYMILITSIGFLFLSIFLSKFVYQLILIIKKQIKNTRRNIYYFGNKIKVLFLLRKMIGIKCKKNFNNLKKRMNVPPRIVSSIFLLIVLLFSFDLQHQTKLNGIYYSLDNNFDQFIFDFRNIENSYYQTHQQFLTIHYNFDDYQLREGLISFFSWDNYFNATTFGANYTYFIDYWNNNISIGQYLALSVHNVYEFDFLKTCYKLFGEQIYSNDEIIVIEKLYNFTSNIHENYSGFQNDMVGQKPTDWFVCNGNSPSNWEVISEKQNVSKPLLVEGSGTSENSCIYHPFFGQNAFNLSFSVNLNQTNKNVEIAFGNTQIIYGAIRFSSNDTIQMLGAHVKTVGFNTRYSKNSWYNVTIIVRPLKSSNLFLQFWINSVFYGQKTLSVGICSRIAIVIQNGGSAYFANMSLSNS